MLDEDEEPRLDESDELLRDEDEGFLLDKEEEPPLDVDEGLLRDEDEGLLLCELLVDDKGLHDELDAGADSPAHGATGSPTFPCPALESASLAAASKACDIEAGVGLVDIKQKNIDFQAELLCRRRHLRLCPGVCIFSGNLTRP